MFACFSDLLSVRTGFVLQATAKIKKKKNAYTLVCNILLKGGILEMWEEWSYSQAVCPFFASLELGGKYSRFNHHHYFLTRDRVTSDRLLATSGSF